MINSITREELKDLLANNKNIKVLDVRSEEEFAAGHIGFAANIPLNQIETGEYSPVENEILVTACGRGGGRARKAASIIKENFQNQVFTLEGGSLGWLDHES